MTCKACEHFQDVSEDGGPYVVRKCAQCGRDIRVREAGDHGIGFKIEKGDQVVIPAAWLDISANPLKGKGHLTRSGLDW